MENEKQQLIIGVFDPGKEVKESIANLQKQQKTINGAMVAVIVVVAIGFIAVVMGVFAIFIDHQDYSRERYNEYIKILEEKEQQLKVNQNL